MDRIPRQVPAASFSLSFNSGTETSTATELPEVRAAPFSPPGSIQIFAPVKGSTGIGAAPQCSKRRIKQATARELMTKTTPQKPFLFRFIDINSQNLETVGIKRLEEDHDTLSIPHLPILQTCSTLRGL
jgi:hypothetical protein